MGNISCRGAIDKALTLPNDGLGFDSQQKKPLFIFFFFGRFVLFSKFCFFFVLDIFTF